MLTNYDSFSVFEGNTGILYLSNGKGEKETFIPNYDLKKVKKLLKEFYKINDEYGTSIKNNYFYSGYNWFPCMVSKLYWHYFFGFIKFSQLCFKNFFKFIFNFCCINSITSVMPCSILYKSYKFLITF